MDNNVLSPRIDRWDSKVKVIDRLSTWTDFMNIRDVRWQAILVGGITLWAVMSWFETADKEDYQLDKRFETLIRDIERWEKKEWEFLEEWKGVIQEIINENKDEFLEDWYDDLDVLHTIRRMQELFKNVFWRLKDGKTIRDLEWLWSDVFVREITERWKSMYEGIQEQETEFLFNN